MIRKFLRLIVPKSFRKHISAKLASNRLSKYGYEALSRINELSEELNIEYWLMFGSLLGAFREHHFIRHDDDLDLAILSNDITQAFVQRIIQEGFDLVSIKESNDQRHRMVSFLYKGVVVDFYGFSFDDDTNITGFSSVPLEGKTYSESKALNKYRCYLLHYKYEGLQKSSFGKIEVPIPVNAEYILKGLYGDSFMKPDKKEKGYNATLAEIVPIEKLYASIINIEDLPR